MSTATEPRQNVRAFRSALHRGWLVIAALLVFAGLIGYYFGQRSTHGDQLHGPAFVGVDQASVKVDDWTYGFSLDGVEWRDTDGGWHHGDRPACLRTPGKVVAIDFGWVETRAPHNSQARLVTWVGCP